MDVSETFTQSSEQSENNKQKHDNGDVANWRRLPATRMLTAVGSCAVPQRVSEAN